MTAAPGLAPLHTLTDGGTPPLRLPGSHFAVAFVFLLAGGAGLVLVAPELAAGAYLSPRVTGVTHLFTLGWITTSIMGALCQLLPVALGRGIAWPRLAQATLWVYAAGLAGFVFGLLTFRPPVLVTGAAGVAAALLTFDANLAVTLRRAPARDATWWALAAAASFLFVTVVVGGGLAANLRWPFIGEARMMALGTHLHVALVGWVLMVMVGVGQRLLPMFLLSHGADERPGKAAIALLAAGTALLFALHHTPGTWARRVPATLILLGVVAFLAQARAFYRTGKRPTLDTGLRMAAAGLVLLGAAALQGGVLSVLGFSAPRPATAYVLTAILGITIFVAAHYYKIVPFLVWLHRFGHLAGKTRVPSVAELYSARWSTVAGALVVLGAAALPVSVLAGTPMGARAGALVLCAGLLVEGAQLVGVARARP